MNKKIISSLFLISIICVMSAPTALAAAPLWALDPDAHAEHLDGYVLLYEFEVAFPGYDGNNITGWFQYWGIPKGCNVSTCTGVLTIGYIEMTTALPTSQMNKETLEAAFEAIGTSVILTDVTADVPNAVFAYTLNYTIFTMEIMMGMAVFEEGKNYAMFAVFDGLVPSASASDGLGISTSSAATSADMKGLMVAVGNAVPPAIPGYDLLIFLGLAGAISTFVIIKKRKTV